MLSHIEISRKNLLSNIKSIKKLIEDKELAAVIKGNAYGHGMNEIAKLIEDEVDYFQVDDAQELFKLREVSNKAAFVFGYVEKDEIEKVVGSNAILGLYDVERLRILNQIGRKLNRKLKFHLKIDSFLGRQGILIDDVYDVVKLIKKSKYILFDGIYTHYSNIEDTSDLTHAQKQVQNFKKAVGIARQEGFYDIKVHISSTSGILVDRHIDLKQDLYRLGIGMYGMWPSQDLRSRYKDKLDINLVPVIRWVSKVAQVKHLPEEYPVGYGLTYITSQKLKVGVVPQGYSDGYDRKLSNVGTVIVNDTPCPVIGRVAMNMFMVDLSEAGDVGVEDEVILLGKSDTKEITAEEIANKISTINYEVTARISPLLPRKVV